MHLSSYRFKVKFSSKRSNGVPSQTGLSNGGKFMMLFASLPLQNLALSFSNGSAQKGKRCVMERNKDEIRDHLTPLWQNRKHQFFLLTSKHLLREKEFCGNGNCETRQNSEKKKAYTTCDMFLFDEATNQNGKSKNILLSTAIKNFINCRRLLIKRRI